jgi:serine protease Do
MMRRSVPVLVAALLAAALAGCGEEGVVERTAIELGVEASRRTALVRAVERVGPSVVGINAIENRALAVSDLSREFFRQFFPDMPTSRNQVQRFGSGIVLDSRGYFLTNDHLVRDAAQVWVTLQDGRQLLAQVVGSDRYYDLAVLRVVQEGSGVFRTAPLNLADDLMVGEWVLALGNPYGNFIADSKPSVTIGVVSAVHRDVKLSEGGAIYKDMIQTDASINPGNSGGPLVNAVGEVVGVNTFILTQGGGSMGLGFAIPISTAIEVAGELIRYGRVRGVWIGIAVQMMTRALADQLGTSDQRGLVVWSLERGSPAERAGIRLGDIIRAVDGEPVADAQAARRSIFGARVEDTIVFTMERGGRLFDIPVTLEELPGETGVQP